MAKRFGVDDVIKYIFLPDGIESDLEDGDDDEEKMYVDDDLVDPDYNPAQDINAGQLEIEVEESGSIDEKEDQVLLSCISSETDAEEDQTNTQQKKKYRWRKKPYTFPDVSFKGEFSTPPDEIPTPLQYFKLFLNDDCMAYIAEQTNCYALAKDGKVVGTSAKEIEQFFGILLFTGMFPCRAYTTYWSNFSRFPLIADIMSRNRFQDHLRYIHFNNNAEMKARDHPDYDPLFKVSPLLKRLRDAMSQLEPEERHSVDEQMIPFKGRSGIKQYIKNKPHHWGFKVFARAGMSGMIYDFMVYTGKAMKLPGNLGVAGNVVMRLVNNLPEDKNFKVYFDNWFSSVDLVCLLKQQNIWSVGTIRSNRLKGCTLKTDKELKQHGRGSLDYKCDDTEGVSIVKWCDNKAVHLISTYCSIDPADKCKRWSVAEKKRIDVERPYVVKEYNQHMGGVGLCDMMLELYRTDIRSKKWYMRIVYYCLDVAVLNAWLLYRRHLAQNNQPSYLPLKDFRSSIASALTLAGKQKIKKRGRPSLNDESTCSSKKTKKALPVTDVRYDGLHHWPHHIAKRMRCRYCPSGYTRVQCSKCLVGLCLNERNNCFMAFHTK
ncbi:unnamed protein product [Clavelina lepadiformis]|uniref:PiggyBac transposable element-derived protein domain-containing protein n=1 Tax=Clavelina lepadiformis TaxID=159417 RepID=A0ABP0FF49_CLALP